MPLCVFDIDPKDRRPPEIVKAIDLPLVPSPEGTEKDGSAIQIE